jgi:hypothetical protein
VSEKKRAVFQTAVEARDALWAHYTCDFCDLTALEQADLEAQKYPRTLIRLFYSNSVVTAFLDASGFDWEASADNLANFVTFGEI